VELQTFTPLMVQKSKTLAPYSPQVVLNIVLTQLPGVSERIGLQRSGSWPKPTFPFSLHWISLL